MESPAVPNVVVISIQGRTSLTTEGRERLEQVANVTYLSRPEPMSQDDALAELADADYVALTPAVMPRLDDDLLDKLPRLKGVSLHATGHDMLDASVLDRRGITLSVLPTYATNAVAEHAMALLLTLSARVHLANDRSRGVVPRTTSLRGFELRGKTAGVLGFGRIGQRVAHFCENFEMNVIACDLKRDRPGFTLVDLPTLLAGSDVIMVCTSMVHDAAPILGPAEFDQMRDDVTIANISRPGLVDTKALLAAVRSGKVRGYAVDEIMHDLTEADADVLREGRIVQSGHCAWWKDQSLQVGKERWSESIYQLATGRPADLVAGKVPAAR